jgi:sec-independent protein translocase protein TatA
MFGLGMWELIVILLIVVIIFGASRLPQIGEGLGKAIRGFKQSLKEPDAIDVTPKKEGNAPKKTEDNSAKD